MCLSESFPTAVERDSERTRAAARDVLADAVAHLRRLGLDRLAIRALLAELLLAQGGHRER